MKITADHFRHLRDRIDDAVQESGYTVKEWQQRYETSNLSPMCFRWDLLWLAFDKDASLLDEIHAYANDDHIDTALRRYVKMRTA